MTLLFCRYCGDEVEMDGSAPVDDDAVTEGDVMCGECRREERDDDDVDVEESNRVVNPA